MFDRGGTQRDPNTALNGKPAYRYQAPRHRCGGAGGSDKWKHTGWTCFECDGTRLGKIRVARLYTAEKLQRLIVVANRRRELATAAARAEAARIAAEQATRREAFVLANADLLATLSKFDGEFWHKFRTDFIERAIPPSTAQLEMINAFR